MVPVILLTITACLLALVFAAGSINMFVRNEPGIGLVLLAAAGLIVIISMLSAFGLRVRELNPPPAATAVEELSQ